MSKIILFDMITVDGYFEGENHDLSWHNVDDEFNEFAIEQLRSADMLMFGRMTYQMMASYWPTEDGAKDDPTVAHLMNSIQKIVFSRTLASAEWGNTRLMKEVDVEEVEKLKRNGNGNIFIFGSSDLAVSMVEKGLLDEVRVIVNPLVLGKGKMLFSGIKHKLPLKLTSTREFKNGNMLMIYDVLK